MNYYVKLRAQDPDKNLDRSYEILLQKGLFNSWTLIVAFGRYGRKSCHSRIYSFANSQEANIFMNKTLKKRLNSFTRIGCNYHLI